MDLLEQVELDLAGSSEVYQRLYHKCTGLAEQVVYQQANQDRTQRNTPRTVLDGNQVTLFCMRSSQEYFRLMEKISKAAYATVDYPFFRSLFQVWPDMRRTFLSHLNTTMTMDLRKVIWFACLQNSQVASGELDAQSGSFF